MKRLSILLCLILGLSTPSITQEHQDKILLTIGEHEITAGEFERIYNKNNTGEGIMDKKSIDEYLELFINFKLKVIEAEKQGLDTMPSFIRELNGYRNQLAKPYLTDNVTIDRLVKEAYERMAKEVSASHILIKLPSNPTPEDTLKAYNKVMRMIDRLNFGESFEAIARGASDDPSAKSNGGNLGYFSAFRMIYPFETAVYNTEVGKISKPVRTNFGYHIIKVNDKRSSRGEVKVAHIMVATPRGSTEEFVTEAKKKTEVIIQELEHGVSFDTLALRYSDDQGSARNGGELPWFSTGRMVPEFEEAAFNLINQNDFSTPVKTTYGWHIIKLIDKKPLDTFETLKPELENLVAKDNRSSIGRNSFIQRLSKEYNFKLIENALAEFYATLDPEFLTNFNNPGKASSLQGPLFSFAEKRYSQEDFLKYIKKYPSKVRTNDVKEYVDKMYSDYFSQELIRYEESQLENKYPEFGYLMQEYHDGILLFELTDKMVWSKAIQDSVGLQEFYNQNKGNYLWEDRVEASIYTCKDESQLKAFLKMFSKRSKKGYKDEDFLNRFNSEGDLYLQIEKGIFSRGDNTVIDSIKWQKGTKKDIKDNGKSVIVIIHEVIKNQAKTLDEAKGLFTSDYQTHLDKEWIKELRSKYPVKINGEVLNAIK